MKTYSLPPSVVARKEWFCATWRVGGLTNAALDPRTQLRQPHFPDCGILGSVGLFGSKTASPVRRLLGGPRE